MAKDWEQLGYQQLAEAESQLVLNTVSALPKQQSRALQASAYTILTNWTKALETDITLRKLYPDDLDYTLGYAFAMASSGKSKQGLERPPVRSPVP